MRLIGIALLAFLLAGVAFLLTERRAEVLAAVPLLSGSERIVHRFDQSGAPNLQDVDESFERVWIAAEGTDRWTALSGVPSYATLRFNLPRDVVGLAGELTLDLRSDIAEGTEGEFRINVNGIRRGVLTIRPGMDDYTVKLPLSADDLIRRQLVVSMAMIGDTPSAVCSTDEGYGALLHVEPTSRLTLALEEPITTFADQLLVAGEPAELLWPVADRDAQAQALATAVSAQVTGHAVRFVRPDQATEATIDPADYDGTLPPSASAVLPLNWPVQAEEAGASTDAVTFERGANWTFALARSALQDRTLPNRLDLNLRLQPLPGEAAWMLNVQHAGSILYQERIAGSRTDYRAIIPLGEADDAELLRYEVNLQADWEGRGPCLIRPELTAQLLPSTQISGGQVAPASAMEPLLAALGSTPSIGIQLWTETDVTTANAMMGLAQDLIVGAAGVEAESDRDVILAMAEPNEALEFARTRPGPAWVRGYFTPGDAAETLPLEGTMLDVLASSDAPRAVMVIVLGSGS
ncbi:hypothetical protein [Pontivivens insulae]|uniref:Cyclic di-GMP-binding protein n=1 Tax=Pontivivens insulae TaxID=1639689 RepID=A0A2R8AG01_9RHOB|nr:hypothetical protein [Pontivivens insulae]RED12243.1 hypothetical protein DFR53_2959 [Pontivivens insulae]SPF31000.1 hypothetical protein POI8812_03347 [Pontivivens insulae]